MGIHRFYHVDRYKQLKEGDVLNLDERGLSHFGAVYWDAIQTKKFEDLTDAEQRECLLEAIRSQPKFGLYASRLQAFFGANTLEDAKRFYEAFTERQPHPVPVYEVFASRYWNLDMNWLDYVNPQERMSNLTEYWHAAISNHNPEEGERRAPMLEVMMALPVTVGAIVAWL